MSLPQFELYRIAHGLTLREVARRAGVAPGYLSELRAGRKEAPSATVVRKIADVFGCEPADLT